MQRTHLLRVSLEITFSLDLRREAGAHRLLVTATYPNFLISHDEDASRPSAKEKLEAKARGRGRERDCLRLSSWERKKGGLKRGGELVLARQVCTVCGWKLVVVAAFVPPLYGRTRGRGFTSQNTGFPTKRTKGIIHHSSI